jgi:tetratricopeptide (TPR) repeat protein
MNMTRSLIRTRAKHHGVLSWLIGLMLLSGAASAVTQDRRLVDLGLERAAGVGEEAHQTLDDTVHAQLQRAAAERAFRLVPLDRVSGLEDEIRACTDAACRLRSLQRVKATHALRGRVARGHDGYVVTLFLEDARSGAFVVGEQLRGSLPEVQQALRAGVDRLLERAAPRDAVARGRLAKTARAYAAKGRHADAARTFARAAAVDPFHPDAPLRRLDEIAALLRADDDASAWSATVEMIELYGPDSAWALAEVGGAARVAEVRALLSARVFDLATASHERAGLRASPELTRDALTRWRAFARAFDDDELAPLAQLYAAEHLYTLGELEDAAALYAAVRDSELDEDSRRLAAASAVFTRQDALAVSWGRGDAPPIDLSAATTLGDPLPLSAAERAYVDTIDALVATFSDHPEAPRAAYRAAHVFAARGELEEARRRFEVVRSTWPGSAPARAANKTLRAFRRTKR